MVEDRAELTGMGPETMGRRGGVFQALPLWAWVLTIAAAAWSLTTVYPLLTLASVVALPLCAALVWTKGECPILFACCAMQWLQAVAATFFCGFYGVELDMVLGSPRVEEASWLSLGGVVSLALGIRLAVSGKFRRSGVAEMLEREGSILDPNRLLEVWIAAFILGVGAQAVGWKVMAVHQFVVPFYNLKWAFFFALCYVVMLRDRGYVLMWGAIGLEFLNGLLGWFSSYKEGLFMFLIAALTLRRALNGKLRLAFTFAIFIGLATSLFWSSVKMDYRHFLSGGKAGAHSYVIRSIPERLRWLGERAMEMDAETVEEGMRLLVGRVQYVSLFGYTLERVPNFVPHSKGELWYGTILHVLKPRFLFPEKAVLDDTERARRFTGLQLAGRKEGTSIGIGYMAESYADFGVPGMFLPILILGFLMGRIYLVSVQNSPSKMLGTGIATAILFSVLQAFAMSNAKIVGSLVVLCLAYWMLDRFGIFARISGRMEWRQP